MILYNKTFALGEGISFSQYLIALRKAYFPNFVITIDKIPSTENYRAQLFYTAPLWKWGLANAFFGGVLLSECRFLYSKGERHFTLQASAKTGNLVFALSYVMGAILLFIFVLFMITTKNTLSLNNISGLIIVTIVILAPSTLTYLRDKNLLDKVGALGVEIENKDN